MLMPFGKRLLTSAVEGEFKQSCVIFPFYFMSLAATAHDGCESLAVPFLLCITLIVYISLSSQAFSPCTCTFISHPLFIPVGNDTTHRQRYKKASNSMSYFIVFFAWFEKYLIYVVNPQSNLFLKWLNCHYYRLFVLSRKDVSTSVRHIPRPFSEKRFPFIQQSLQYFSKEIGHDW